MSNPFDIFDARLSNIETLLLDIKHDQKTTLQTRDKNNDLLTIKQAAEFLNSAASTIYGKVNKKVIPHMKRGGRLYFSRIELMQWIQEGRRATRDEIDKQVDNFMNNKKSPDT